MLWCYAPVEYGLADHADAVIYHCVDLLCEIPRVSPSVIHAGERRLAALGATAIGSSEVVADHLQDLGFGSVLRWPNVADLEVFSRDEDTGRRQARAVFAGNLTGRKVAFDLISALLGRGIPVDLAGPVAEGGGADADAVDELVNQGAVYHGHLDLEGLSALLGHSSVGLIPYVINNYTQGVSPLKTYEYLASGMSVVSTPVPAVEPIDGDVFVHASTSGFVEAVSSLLHECSSADVARRRRLASDHGWSARGSDARALVARAVDSSVS